MYAHLLYPDFHIFCIGNSHGTSGCISYTNLNGLVSWMERNIFLGIINVHGSSQGSTKPIFCLVYCNQMELKKHMKQLGYALQMPSGGNIQGQILWVQLRNCALFANRVFNSPMQFGGKHHQIFFFFFWKIKYNCKYWTNQFNCMRFLVLYWWSQIQTHNLKWKEVK